MPFTKTAAVYTTPNVRLVLSGAAWLSDAAVSSWTVDRRLVASVIPGELRSIQPGLSVGAASLKVINTESRVTPWSPDPARLVRTDLPAASLEVVDGDDTLPLGSWVLNPVSGALSSREVDVDLLEAQYAGKQVPQRLEPYGSGGLMDPFAENSPVDPIWVVGRMAARAGFDPVPGPVPSALLAMPLHGGFGAVPTERYPISPFRPEGTMLGDWEVLPGDVAVGASGAASLLVLANPNEVSLRAVDVLAAGGSIFVTLNVVGEVWMSDAANNWVIHLTNDPDAPEFSFAVANDGTEPASSTSFTGQQSDDWPTRVQIEMQRDWDDDNGQWTELRARIRSGPDASWSSWVTDSSPYSPLLGLGGIEYLLITAGYTVIPDVADPGIGQFAALQVTTEADPDLWLPSKWHLQPLGGDMGIPWVPAGMSANAAIQAVSSAWLAAAIVGNDGIGRTLTKDDLAGVADGDPIVVDVDLADLPWESDPNDVHDRLEVTYSVPTVHNADSGSTKFAPEAWRAGEVIHAPANATISIDAVMEERAAAGIFRTFSSPGTVPDSLWSTTSSINVFSNPDGEGTEVSVDAYSVRAEQTSTTTARITYVNRTGSSQFLVTDADLDQGAGEPSLVLRAYSVVSYAPVLITRGLSAADAVNPLAVDLTPWVQREQDAESIANYLWGRLSGRVWKVNSVKCRLDWTLDIGQVRTLTHPDSGLESKVLITRVHFDGKPGQIRQTLDLVLIPWTYADFAATWEAEDTDATYADFATAQGPTRTYEDMAADAEWTGV